MLRFPRRKLRYLSKLQSLILTHPLDIGLSLSERNNSCHSMYNEIGMSNTQIQNPQSKIQNRKVVIAMADADKREVVRLTSLAFCAG